MFHERWHIPVNILIHSHVPRFFPIFSHVIPACSDGFPIIVLCVFHHFPIIVPSFSIMFPSLSHVFSIIFPLVGGFNPLKNISQLGWVSPRYGKIKNVPNHQPVPCCSITFPSFSGDFLPYQHREKHSPPASCRVATTLLSAGALAVAFPWNKTWTKIYMKHTRHKPKLEWI